MVSHSRGPICRCRSLTQKGSIQSKTFQTLCKHSLFQDCSCVCWNIFSWPMASGPPRPGPSRHSSRSIFQHKYGWIQCMTSKAMTGLLHGGVVSPKTRGAFGPEHIPVDGFRDLTQRPTCLRQLLVIIFYIYLKGDL